MNAVVVVPVHRRFVAVALVATSMVVVGGAAPPPGAAGAGPVERAAEVESSLLSGSRDLVRVIVQAADGAVPAAERAVRRLGGRITLPLPLVGGFAATLPGSAVAGLAGDPSVRVVSEDGRVRVMGSTPQDTPTSAYTRATKATRAWKAGVTGHGVTVALIDTGVSDVPDLAGRIVPVTTLDGSVQPCMNLSGESHCGDSYGHGTFMAGIIAGDGTASGGRRKGMAPGAGILSVKIAGRSGAADTSTLLAAIQWVVSYRDTYGIRALNLSLGTDSTQSYRTSPLNFAVERAWAAGIAVVVSAGNRGPDPGTISKPGDDPWVITVGAVDDRGTATLSDDEVPDFSSRGPTAGDGLAKPDVAAPGAHVASLRAHGSAIDEEFPTYLNQTYRKGSGTSMASAVVTGTLALMMEAQPAADPDRLKYALVATAKAAASADRTAVGAGMVNAYKAALAPPAGRANQGLLRSTGLGSLEWDRGGVRVQTTDEPVTVIFGLLTAQLLPFDALAYVNGEWDGRNWRSSDFGGRNWRATDWVGSDWSGRNWRGSNWDSSRWYGRNWRGSAWYGAWE